jgi:hypothetical protein
MYVEEQTITNGRPVERMKEGCNKMMKCVNFDLVVLLGKYLS